VDELLDELLITAPELLELELDELELELELEVLELELELLELELLDELVFLLLPPPQAARLASSRVRAVTCSSRLGPKVGWGDIRNS
jgi:hypothetical protein